MPRPVPIFALIALGCAVLVVIGSFGPWAQVRSVFGTLSVNGLDGDGKFTLVAGFVAGLLQVLVLAGRGEARWLHIGSAAVLTIAAAIGAYDWRDIARIVTDVDSDMVIAQVGWGLQLLTVAAVAGGISAAVAAFIENSPEPVYEDVESPASST